MNRKIIIVIVCIIAAIAVWHFSLQSASSPAPLAPLPITAPVNSTEPVANANTMTIGWSGDLVPATDIGYNLTVLNNVADNLAVPDVMMGNLEGTFAKAGRTSKCTVVTTNCFAFAGDSSFADTLKAAGFDFVSLINNHSLDYGMAGLQDTEAQLNRVGLAYIAPNKPTTSITVKGVTIGIMGVSSTPPSTITNYSYIAQTVETLKKKNDIVIVIFHGGAEGNNETAVTGGEEYEGTEDRGNVEAVAHTAINAGADLVLGDGPHVLRKTEWYHNKLIAYSLGNFVGGNGRLDTSGNMGLGGIFTAFFQPDPTTHKEVVQQNYDFTSVILDKTGIPSIDPANQAKHLLDSLSN
jgi:hypothetical protein